MPKQMLYMTILEFEKEIKKNPIVILPVGTIEVHGLHLPLGTDAIIPEKIATELGERFDAIVAPTIYYGYTRSLKPYKGSLSVRESIFAEYVRDVVRSFCENGAKTIIIINGHGRQGGILHEKLLDFYERYGVTVIIIDWWILARSIDEEFFGYEGGHAGISETSMIMAIDESLVDKEAAKETPGYMMKEGVYVIPFPAPFIKHHEKETLEVDYEKATKYFEKVVDEIERTIRDILAKLSKTRKVMKRE